MHIKHITDLKRTALEANFIVLAPDTTYIVRYTNDGSQSGVFALNYVLQE